MEGVEGVGKAVLADVLLLGGEVLAVPVHIRQDVHGIVLEHLVQLPQVGPPLLVEPAVADAGDDKDAPVGHDALVANHLGGKGLHHLDGVGAHACPVVEVGGHPEDDDVVLLLGPVDIGALVGHRPADGL